MRSGNKKQAWRLPPPTRPIVADLKIPGDKSISHRVLMMAAMARGKSVLDGVLISEDTRATLAAMQAMGASIKLQSEGRIIVEGRGLEGLNPPAEPIDCGNSGTTLRLLAGLLATLGRGGILIGDASLSRRPMARIVEPLTAMGARIRTGPGAVPPLSLEPSGPLRGIAHVLAIASGQIKGALLLAALGARGITRLSGALSGRDHTERLLTTFGAELTVSSDGIALSGPQHLVGAELRVPGDLSSLAFWLCAAALTPGSHVCCRGVGANPTRTGFVQLLGQMGAHLRCLPETAAGSEPVMTLHLTHGRLRGIEVLPEQIPALIDELPLVALLATQADGQTRVRGAHELRHKESDRLEALREGLEALGGTVQLQPDGFDILGPQRLRGGRVRSHRDHRIAMMLAVASTVTHGPVELEDPECIKTSYPEFGATWRGLTEV